MLRIGGATFQAIADQLGYAGREAASYAVRAGLGRLGDEFRERIIALHTERLDNLLAPFSDRALRGDHKALDAVLDILDQQARLAGLKAAPEG